MHEKNETINKEIEIIKKKQNRNSEGEMYNRLNEKFTKFVQQQIWASRRKVQQI